MGSQSSLLEKQMQELEQELQVKLVALEKQFQEKEDQEDHLREELLARKEEQEAGLTQAIEEGSKVEQDMEKELHEGRKEKQEQAVKENDDQIRQKLFEGMEKSGNLNIEYI